MRTYLSPVGFDSRRVTRPVLSNGIDREDRVVLLSPANNSTERAEEAIDAIEQMLGEVQPQLTLTVESVDHTNLESALLDCSDLLRAAEGEVVATLGGGARDVLLPFLMATLVHLDRVDTVLFFSDIDGSVTDWALPSIGARVPGRCRDTLAAILAQDDPISIPDLSRQVDAAKSTVTRHVADLEAEGIVTTWTEGKTKHVETTLTGRLVAAAQEE